MAYEIRPAWKRSDRLMQPRYVQPLTVVYEVFVHDPDRVLVPHWFDRQNNLPLEVDRNVNHPDGHYEERWVSPYGTPFGPKQYATLEEAQKVVDGFTHSA